MAATIAADPKHPGARIGQIAVLHSWGRNVSCHPHLHCIVPGAARSGDGREWIAGKPGFFLPVRVLSRLFRRLFLEALTAAHEAGERQFLDHLASLNGSQALAAHPGPPRKANRVVYPRRPFAGPEQVLACLARYTHRVAIANSRLISWNDNAITFKWRDDRHRQRRKTMTLKPDEFIRRFLLHVLPPGCHRIRHYRLLANARRRAKLARARKPIQIPDQPDFPEAAPEAANDNKSVRRWARKRTRPSAPHDQRTKWACIFGAIGPAKGNGAGLLMPWCDIPAMDCIWPRSARPSTPAPTPW